MAAQGHLTQITRRFAQFRSGAKLLTKDEARRIAVATSMVWWCPCCWCCSLERACEGVWLSVVRNIQKNIFTARFGNFDHRIGRQAAFDFQTDTTLSRDSCELYQSVCWKP
jgi:hypothetical protein